MYKAVDRNELIRLLGKQCSPKEKNHPYWREYWYVVGPTESRALAHLGTCMDEKKAKKMAKEWNKRELEKRGEK